MGWFYFTVAVLLKSAVILGILLVSVVGLLLAERKIMGWMQLRPGPILVGPWGLFQPIADALKIMFKEDITPLKAFRPIYWVAPGLVAATALFMFAVIPFGPWSVNLTGYSETHPGLANFPLGYVTDLKLGVLYLLGMSSLSVYGVAWGGWSSGSKYSLLGGMRSAAQMISYELTLGLTFLSIVVINGTLSLVDIVRYQAQYGWNLFYQPVTFVVFVITMFAETNRLPFDLPEAEHELTGGYHTEHSSMKFGLFFMGEYLHMIVSSCICSLLFLGGWLPPFANLAVWDVLWSVPGLGIILPLLFFGMKVGFFLFLFIWVRSTFPRLRYDQLMKFGWKFLLEVAFVNLFIAGLMKAAWPQPNYYWYALQAVVFVVFVMLSNTLSWKESQLRTVRLEPG